MDEQKWYMATARYIQQSDNSLRYIVSTQNLYKRLKAVGTSEQCYLKAKSPWMEITKKSEITFEITNLILKSEIISQKFVISKSCMLWGPLNIFREGSLHNHHKMQKYDKYLKLVWHASMDYTVEYKPIPILHQGVQAWRLSDVLKHRCAPAAGWHVPGL